MKRESRATAVVVVLCTLVFGCGRMADSARPVPEGKSAGEFGASLSQLVTTEAMMAHLSELQTIADRHDGNRAVGTPGYDASVDYVAGVLRDNGFDVQLPEFQLRVFETEKPELTVGGVAIDARSLEYSAGTPGVSGPLVAAPADDTPGCVPADYDGLPVKGAVVLVGRGSCPFAEKQAIAAKLGAVAMVVANNVDEEEMGGTLGSGTEVTMPVISVSKADGARLRAAPGPTTVKLTAATKTVSARNVIVETKTGSAQDVVMVGAHLDSVAEGPGINDNGSGVAALLETAVQLGSSPEVKNVVRFGFWGAEELGIVGSRKYIESLDVEGLKNIALYLNFDMIGSPNPGYFTYDGDQSTALEGDESPPRVPEGSPGIERTLAEYLDSVGKTAGDTSFDGRSDYDGFTRAGIPAGGLFTGAEGKMTTDEAELWDGTADAPFDPNYHTDSDTLANVDRDALGINGGGVAYVVGVYAKDLDGRNGMPAREDRTRHVVVAEP